MSEETNKCAHCGEPATCIVYFNATVVKSQDGKYELIREENYGLEISDACEKCAEKLADYQLQYEDFEVKDE